MQLVTILPWVAESRAETYQWVDREGTIHFSDNPQSLPKRSRASVRHDVEMSKNHNIPEPKEVTKGQFNDNKQVDFIPKQSSSAVDGNLRLLWESHRNALARHDIKTALDMIHPSERTRYQQMFAALSGKLPEIVSTYRELNLVRLTGRGAQYELVTRENKNRYSYQVDFVKDDNNQWFIYSY